MVTQYQNVQLFIESKTGICILNASILKYSLSKFLKKLYYTENTN